MAKSKILEELQDALGDTVLSDDEILFLAKLPPKMREFVCRTYNDGEDGKCLILRCVGDVIASAQYYAHEMTNAKIDMAFRLCTCPIDDIEYEPDSLVEAFLKLCLKQKDRKGIRYLFNLFADEEVPWWVAQWFFKRYTGPKRFRYKEIKGLLAKYRAEVICRGQPDFTYRGEILEKGLMYFISEEV
ncbi:MAG: hypothetical protein LBK50_02630 [Candidatus Nomurabacteria bacterium]|jgi:hypothetical protein|nr:hypothetical protein [Candidatus Nomurabacteria bacterium]